MVIVPRRRGRGRHARRPLGGGGAENKRVRLEVFAAASNLFNPVNPIGYSGVITSPFFGRPTAARPGRKIDIGMRIGF